MPRKPAKLSDLAPAPYNPRHITDEALAGLKRSVEEFGDLSGITWNSRTGHLVTGHQRVKALTKRYGPDLVIKGDWLETPDGERFRVRVVDWEETTEKAANVAANNHLIAGDFTDDIQGIIDELQDEIPELVEELRFEELEVELFGPHETVDHDGSAGPEESETPEIVKKWGVRRGQLWRCGGHLVYCGDSLDDDLPFPSRCDVVITDPPYQMDPADVRRVILAVADRASVLCAQKQAYALCDGHAEPSSTKWTRERSGALEFKHSMMWVHGQPRAGRGVNRHAPIMYHNEIVVCARRGVATGWERPRSAFSSVIGDGGGGFTNFGFGQGKSEHPFAEMIICYPDAKIVGDPFLGTGSTLVAADKTGRICYGVELDEAHLAICLERCARLGLDPQLDAPGD